MGEAAGLRLHQRPAHGRKTQLAQGEQRQWESCETKRTAHDVTADRRMGERRSFAQSEQRQWESCET